MIESFDINIDGNTTENICEIFRPCSSNMIDQKHVHEYRYHLNNQWSKNVTLRLKVSLSCVEESETVNGRQQLEEILTDDISCFLINMLEHNHKLF